MKYLSWDQQTITDFSEENINEMYEKGYLFTRLGRGVMQQTRSVRLDLAKFTLSSENRRILKKIPDLELLPGCDTSRYDYSIGKMAKDFYATKFGPGIMSAQKIKEILTDTSKSNFNFLLKYSSAINSATGYAITFKTSKLLHYSYPFYDLNNSPRDMGLAMMIKAVIYAKENQLKYIYLGSLQRPSDVYKLQFEGLEWFDGKRWSQDIEEVKHLLKSVI